jgi:phenylpropionate dioxygenase-like ring-hydroxylating dioxygenase large terminal subunit
MPCLDLPRQELQHWNGMLFNGKRQVAKDLAKLGVAKELDFEGYQLNKVEAIEYGFNWKTFIEVYLEDYHVGPFHPGLGRFVTCDDLKWEFGDWHSVQTVGVNQRLGTPGSEPTRSGTTRCSTSGTASRRPTARSGSPTTRT